MRKLPLSWANSRFERQMFFKEVTWGRIKKDLSTPIRGEETFAEYLTWDREKQTEAKDCGYAIIGEFRGNIRHNTDFIRRGSVTLDIDQPGLGFQERLRTTFAGLELFWYTTRKHCPDKPRIRVHLPLAQDVLSADEYEALTRKMAERYDIERVDTVSYRGAQMMFRSSVCADGEFLVGEQAGAWLEPADVLFEYLDPRDRSEWPRNSGEVPPESRRDKAERPESKPGVIGAFCRAFTLDDVLHEHLAGVYEPAGENRWRYHASEGAGGAVAYPDGGFYSSHTGHDPGAGRSLNAFDLVRVHKYGDLDVDPISGETVEAPAMSMPSFKAMQAWAMTLEPVVAELRHEGAFEDLDDAESSGAVESETGRPVTASHGGNGHAKVNGTAGAITVVVTPRDRLRAMMADCIDGDELVDRLVPAVAGAGLDKTVETTMLREISDRHKALTKTPDKPGTGLDVRALAADVGAARKLLNAKTQDDSEGLPSRVQHDDEGSPVNSLDNMCEWLQEGHAGVRIGLDKFTMRQCVQDTGSSTWSPITEEKQLDIRRSMERAGFKNFGGGNDVLKMAITSVADVNKFDMAHEWIEQQIWDGVKRVSRFWTTYCGVLESEYSRSVAEYWWESLAGRIVKPGVKADMMPVLFGAQGMRKSSSVEAMVPQEELATVFAYKSNDDNQGRLMEGRLIAEWSELRGLNNMDEDGIKTFLSRRKDTWVPKYKEIPVTRARRIMFLGTTDKKEFLSDAAGNRRYLPIRPKFMDVEAIKRDMPQLYAEGLEMFLANGSRVDHRAEHLAKEAHAEHTIGDEWDDKVEEFLAQEIFDDEMEKSPGVRRGDGVFKSSEVLEFIGHKLDRIGRPESLRLARILRRMGYDTFDGRLGGQKIKGWAKKNEPN